MSKSPKSLVLQKNYGIKTAFIRYITPKMEPRIWNKSRIWNTFAANRSVFHMRGFTVLLQLRFMDELIWWFQEPKIFKCRLTFEMRKILVSTNDFQIPISNDIKNVV